MDAIQALPVAWKVAIIALTLVLFFSVCGIGDGEDRSGISRRDQINGK